MVRCTRSVGCRCPACNQSAQAAQGVSRYGQQVPRVNRSLARSRAPASHEDGVMVFEPPAVPVADMPGGRGAPQDTHHPMGFAPPSMPSRHGRHLPQDRVTSSGHAMQFAPPTASRPERHRPGDRVVPGPIGQAMECKPPPPPFRTAEPPQAAMASNPGVMEFSPTGYPGRRGLAQIDAAAVSGISQLPPPEPPPGGLTGPACHRCRASVNKHRDLSVDAFGLVYHVACYSCGVCGQDMQEKQVADGGGRLGILCPPCNARSKQRTCHQCHKLVLEERWPVDAESNPYHPGCFVCNRCEQSLGGQTYTKDPVNGRLMCRSCFDRDQASGQPEPGHGNWMRTVSEPQARAPQCAQCRRSMKNDGVSWKDKAFHPDCFACKGCGANLWRKGVEAYNNNGDPVCEHCIGRPLQTDIQTLHADQDIRRVQQEMNPPDLVLSMNARSCADIVGV
eukprot:TRINITY_DN6415_c0_g1_i3.p1 TRINITY_DN6415_c0_g1~~TRINITY_DN6415_c0_g1_i3.p1  ORF type:complete len:449 (+),score=21.47 TRINITY_DN6415_c0_g1_i3:243-1589(+)